MMLFTNSSAIALLNKNKNEKLQKMDERRKVKQIHSRGQEPCPERIKKTRKKDERGDLLQEK
jgi:hypothetical protein